MKIVLLKCDIGVIPIYQGFLIWSHGCGVQEVHDAGSTLIDKFRIKMLLYFEYTVFIESKLYLRTLHISINWASEASPTLGCSIEISRVYICVCRGPKCARRSTWPNTRMLKVRS